MARRAPSTRAAGASCAIRRRRRTRSPRGRPRSCRSRPRRPCSRGVVVAAADAGRLRRAARARRGASRALADRWRRRRARGDSRRADRELLAWLAGARCALTSQIHRRVNPGRSLTVTQRALKRLADRGLIARFQLHRDDGGGVSAVLCGDRARDRAARLTGRHAPALGDRPRSTGLRADVHLVGWLLALEARAGGRRRRGARAGPRGDRRRAPAIRLPRAGPRGAGARLPRQPARTGRGHRSSASPPCGRPRPSTCGHPATARRLAVTCWLRRTRATRSRCSKPTTTCSAAGGDRSSATAAPAPRRRW